MKMTKIQHRQFDFQAIKDLSSLHFLFNLSIPSLQLKSATCGHGYIWHLSRTSDNENFDWPCLSSPTRKETFPRQDRAWIQHWIKGQIRDCRSAHKIGRRNKKGHCKRAKIFPVTWRSLHPRFSPTINKDFIQPFITWHSILGYMTAVGAHPLSKCHLQDCGGLRLKTREEAIS